MRLWGDTKHRCSPRGPSRLPPPRRCARVRRSPVGHVFHGPVHVWLPVPTVEGTMVVGLADIVEEEIVFKDLSPCEAVDDVYEKVKNV